MRRYSRYKICKTNFHFFFLSSRVRNFNRPKWNSLKEKIENFTKTKKQKLPNIYKTKYSKFVSHYFFNLPVLFKSLKKGKKTPVILHDNSISRHLIAFDYSFLK
jgi:hypothetical protein